MRRTKVALIAAPLAVVAVAVFFGVKIHAELVRGAPVFWMAELWPPAAVLTIILVVCIDVVVPRPSKDPDAPQPRHGPDV